MSAMTPSLPIAERRIARRRPPAGAGALARIEGRRLLCHPVFLISVGLSLFYFRDEGDGATWQAFLDGWAFLPVAAGTLITANLAALRSRRDRTDELYGSLPAPRCVRIAGQMLGLLWAVPVCAALLAAAYIDNRYNADHLGALYTPGLVELAQGPALVIALGAIGILLARVAPSVIAGPLLIVAIFAAQVPGWNSPETWAAWLLPLAQRVAVESGASIPCEAGAAAPGCGEVIGYATSGLTWHLSYVVGLTLLAGAAALVGGRRPLAFAGLAALAVALAVGTKLAAG